MAAVDVADDVGVGFQDHILVNQARAGNRRAAGVDGALDAVLARPGHHFLGLVAGLDRAQTDLAQQPDTGLGEFLEVLLDHAFFNDGRAGQHLDAARAEFVKGALRRDGQRLQTNDVLGTPGQVHLAGRDHGGDTAVHGGVDPADLVLARRPVAKHRVYMAVNQAGCHAGLVHVNDGARMRHVAVLGLAHGNDQAILHHDGVGIQDGPVDVAGQQQTDVGDDDFAGFSVCNCFSHGVSLGSG